MLDVGLRGLIVARSLRIRQSNIAGNRAVARELRVELDIVGFGVVSAAGCSTIRS